MTSSVKLAGVVVVFALLVGLALVAVTLFERHQLWEAWIYGMVVNSVFFLDLTILIDYFRRRR